MKIKTASFLAWAFALMAFVTSAQAVPASARVIARSNAFITSATPFATVAFQVTNATSVGARYLIQARGVAQGEVRPLDPEILMYKEVSGGLQLLGGNDDWTNPWRDGGNVVTPVDRDRLVAFQRLAHASTLSLTDSALAVSIHENGYYTVTVMGWGNSVGLVDLTVYEINEAPEPTFGLLSSPIIAAGDGIILRLWSKDADGDQVQFEFDVNNDGQIDFVSPWTDNGKSFFPTFLRAPLEPGDHKIVITARDSRGAKSAPAVLNIQVPGAVKG